MRISKEKFPLYLKEMEFRYNNRYRNIFNLLIENLCRVISNHAGFGKIFKNERIATWTIQPITQTITARIVPL